MHRLHSPALTAAAELLLVAARQDDEPESLQ